MKSKVRNDAIAAVSDQLRDGMTILSGGFGLCGIPDSLIDAIRESNVRNLTVVTNNPGVDGIGVGKLVQTRQVSKLIASYIGENATFAKQYLAGDVEVEFNPQGTLGG